MRAKSELDSKLTSRALILNKLNKNASFTISEGLFPSFVENNVKNLSLFPLNLGTSDYAIIEIDSINGLPYVYPWVFPETIRRNEIQLCFQRRLEAEYVYLNEFNNFYIYKKINQ